MSAIQYPHTIVPSYFVNRLNYKITELQRFGSRSLLPFPGKNEEGDDTKPISWGPLVVLASDLVFLHLNKAAESSFPKDTVL
jgi:hypothetical protein